MACFLVLIEFDTSSCRHKLVAVKDDENPKHNGVAIDIIIATIVFISDYLISSLLLASSLFREERGVATKTPVSETVIPPPPSNSILPPAQVLSSF
jgi:hypothetical protein